MLKVVGASWMKIRMSTWIIGIVLVLGVVVVILGQMRQLQEDGNYSATAYWNEETGFEIKFWGQGLDFDAIPKGVARVYYQSHIDTTGWAVIDLETQSDYPDWVQAFAAGMLEGSLSWQFIYWHWQNTVQNVCENQKPFCDYVKAYLEENLNSVRKSYEKSDDPYWHQIYLFYLQLEGMKQGFEHGMKRSRQTVEELQMVDFSWMNAAGDVVDLERKFYDSTPHANGTNYSRIEKPHSHFEIPKEVNGTVRHSDESSKKTCISNLGSAFVKLLPEEGKLFVAHNTAGPYVSMLRMIKNYHFRYRLSSSNFSQIENKLTFSSYPGAIHSMDDFYIISKGERQIKLAITGTPITVYNKNLWKFVSPLRQVLSGYRTIATCRLSDKASDWARYMSRNNSGTGNKQWMIVDVNKFKKIGKFRGENEDIAWQNIFWVAEQIPNLFLAQDQTEILRKNTYWASYGLPFYANVSELSGTDEIRKIFGDAFSHENSSLAKIYRRDNSKVVSVKSAIDLMRSNSYRTDPLSLGDPRCAIGARGDIPAGEASHPFPIGVIDSKVYSAELETKIAGGGDTGDAATNQTATAEREKTFWAIAGPAHSVSASAKERRFRAGEEMEEEEEGQQQQQQKQKQQQQQQQRNDTVEDRPSEEDELKPFNWAKSLFVRFPHNGHPDEWDFRPIRLPVQNLPFSGTENL